MNEEYSSFTTLAGLLAGYVSWKGMATGDVDVPTTFLAGVSSASLYLGSGALRRAFGRPPTRQQG